MTGPTDLPKDADHRLEELRHGFFTSDLSVNEFLLVKECGFHPLGFVMGSSIYHTGIQGRRWSKSQELTKLTEAMYNARELAMTRMEEEADELGADGVVGVRLDVNYYEWGSDAAEFIALGTAVKAEDGKSYRNKLGKPFTSDLSGQDFWTIMQTGYTPQGLVMGTCVYHIAHRGLAQALGSVGQNVELPNFTQALYEAPRAGNDAHAGRGQPAGRDRDRRRAPRGEEPSVGVAHDRVPLDRHRRDQDERRGDLAASDRDRLARQLMSDQGDLPEAAPRRLESGSFSSGLTVPDFAACLQMGLRPVGLVQGFCAMQWGWYGAGSPYMRGMSPYAPAGGAGGAYAQSWYCPHGFVSGEHRMWGQNYEQTWVEEAWLQGFRSAFGRLIEEAKEVGAHGIIGVTDTSHNLPDMNVAEFHVLGTAVVIDGAPPPPKGEPWSTYLAGQRLAKLVEAGFMPISVIASIASVRVWAYCVTEYLMEGGSFMWSQGSSMVRDVEQISAGLVAAPRRRATTRGASWAPTLSTARR